MLVCFMISFDENGKWKEIEFQCFSIYDYDKINYMYYIDTKGKKDQSINILSIHIISVFSLLDLNSAAIKSMPDDTIDCWQYPRCKY